jgi:hypothetical protein
VIAAALLLAAAQVTDMLAVEEVIPARHRLVEGVATDGRRIWVSSVIDREILRCPRRRTIAEPRCKTFATLPSGLHPLGIAWDTVRRWLWVTADCPPLPELARCDRGALIAYDSRGRERRRIAPIVGEFHPGDVSAERGQVFVSDSHNGMVFHLTRNGRAIMAVILPDTGRSAQGTALDQSGTSVVVADYSQGIAITGLGTFKRILLPAQDGKALRGIDGLARCGAVYYGIANGGSPQRLVSFTIQGSAIAVRETDIRLLDPTQIAFDGERLLVVSDSGWAEFEKGPRRWRTGAAILAIPLGKDCRPE